MKHLIKTMAFTLLGLVLSSNVWALTSVAPANGKTVAIVAVTGTSPNEKYYALPQISSSASASTFNGVEISVNNSGYAVKKDGGAEVPTWTLVKNSSNANQYYISYSAGASTYYLYKNGTSSSSNYNIKVVSSSQHYWTFATSGDGYSIKSERGSAAQYLQLNSNKKFQVSGTQTLYLLELAPSFTITAQSNNTTYGTVSLSGNVITASPKAGYTYDYPAYTVTSGSAEVEQDGDKFTVKTTADCTVRINFAIKQTATIKLSEAGIITDGPSGKYSGDQYTLPTTCNQSCGDKTFVGWSTETVDSETKPTANTYHEPGEEVTLAANNTFYAVFADEGEDGGVVYQKVSSVSEGRYVLVSEKTSGTYKYMPSTESAGSNPALGSGITMTTSGGVTKLTNSVTDAMLWDLTSTGTTNEYYIRPKGSTTIGLGTTTSTGGNIRISGTYKDTKWTITTSTNYNWQFKNNNTTAMYLAVYADNAWRNYSNSTTNQNGKFYLFKEESNITYSNYTTTCAAPRDIDHIEVTGTPATFWKGDEFNHTGMTVKAYYTEGDPDDVTGSATYSGYDMSVAGEQTVTVTYKSKTDTYEIDVKTIANTQVTAYTATEAIAKYKAGKDLSSFVYVKGIVSKIVTAFSESYGNISFNVSADGETTGDQFQFYRNFKGANKAKWASADEAPQVGDEVIGYGTLTAFGETYEFAEGNYIVSLTRPKVLQSISVSGTPESFDTEKEFNSNNMVVTAHYNPGHADAVVTENATFTPVDWGTEGNHTINVSYTENGVTKGTTYVINVLPHCNQFVEITKGTPQHGSFTLSAEGEQCADGLVVTVTPNAAEHYHFKQITATNGDVDDNAKTVSNITANTTINVEFEEDEKVTVKWHVGTAAPVETADVYVGTAFADVKANAPAVEDGAAGDCADKFMGWATSAITAQDGVDEEDVAWATEPISNENKEFYAVWAKQGGSPITWTKMAASEISESGTYALIESSGKAFNGTINSGHGQSTATAFAFNNNVASSAPEGTLELELTAYGDEEDGYVFDIYNSTKGYLYAKQASSGNLAWSTKALGDDDYWTYDTDDKNFEFWHYPDYDYYFASLRYSSSSFRTYVSNSTMGTIVAFAKKNGGLTYSNYITSCFIPTYSVTIQSNNTTMGTAAINPEHIKDAYEQGDELEIKATVTDGAIYRFVNWTIEPETTGASLYMGANEAENLLTVGSGDVTLTANFEEIPANPITVTLNVGEHGTLDCDDCEGNQLTEETAGEGVLVPNVNATTGWAFLGWSTSSTATEADFEVAVIFYPSEENNTLYAVYSQLYKVTLRYTDEVKWQETAGGAITLPSRDCKNETYKGHFAGWSETEFSTETTNPATTPTIYPVGDFVPTADITLFPVFSVSTMGGTKWVKKTGDQVTEGVYAILCSSEKAFNGSRDGGHGLATETAFAFDANGVATSVPSGICEITMQSVDGGFKMYNADNGYLYATAASSGKLAWDAQGTSATSYWKWGGSSNQNWIYNSNSAYLRSYNDESKSFRTYGANNGDGPVHFAKKESVEENKYWSTPANDVTNPELDTPAGDYLSPLTVKITEDSYDENLIYYYTTDGTTPAADAEWNPTGTSAMYEPTTGIVLEPAQTFNLKVIGYDEDGYTSQIASATYVLYPVFNSISDMYAGATINKPVGLVLTNAYVHAVNTIGQNSQIFVQQGDLGVVLSVTTANIPEGVEAGKQISGTAVGTYTITNARPQISYFEFQSTFSVSEGTRPEPIKIDATTIDKVSTNLLGLVKLEGVYAQSEASNVIVVNSNAEGTGTSMNVYDFFNKVSTIPASDVKCNVIGLFNERQNNSDPIVYSVMPVLATDFDVVEKQDAQLPTVSPLGSIVEAEPLGVANGEQITITPVAGFTTSYKVNDAAEWTTTPLYFNISETNTKLEIKATRPYYNDASVAYYYQIDPGLTKYHITLPPVQPYYKISSDVTDQKAGETVTLTISNITEHWNITGVTVEKADDETKTVEVANPETNKYTFVMPAYAVNVKVSYKSDPTYNIDYLRGITGSTGDDITESKQYAGVELTLKECTWKAAGYTFKNWYAYYLDDESQEVAITITDNKIFVPAHDVKIKAMWDEAAWHKEGTWELVTKTTELGIGDYVIFTDTLSTAETRNAGSSTVNTTNKNLKATSNISIEGNKLTRTNNDATMIFQIETGNETNTYAFYADGIGYLNANGTGTNNYMITTESKASVNASWEVKSIYASTGGATVQAKSSNRNLMQLNGSIFAAYGSKQKGLAIYKFYPKAWTVTFDDNVEDEEITVPEMQRADPTTNKVTISDMIPVRTGYDFSIWNSAKGGTGVTSANPTDEITLSANTTLYAQWNIKQYNVAVAEVENVTIQAKPYSEEVIAEGGNANVNFKKSVVLSYSDLHEDYVFKSWKVTKADDETTVVPVSVGSSTTFEVPAYAVTVSAIIESKATTQLTVTYHANGGKNKTAGDPEEVSEQVNWNTTIKFAEHPCPFEKNLCTFAGWNTKADGTGTTYKTQVTVKSDIDLYAMWEASAVEYVIDDNVEAKVKVQEGVAPTGSAATFVTTYMGTFGQLTNTHKGTLTLTGYAGKVITGVKMQMRSNGSSGAGTIVIKVGDKEICSTSYAESFGSHSSSYSVAELANFNAAIIGETENITIVVSCTDNSLYIKGYTIEYTDPEIIRNELAVDQYTTFCWPKTIPANAYTGATFWNIESKTTMADGRLSSITIVQHEGDLEAGVPYIMYNTATEFKCYQTGEAVDAPAAEGNNGLVGVFEITMFDTKIRPVTDDADAAARGIYIISDGTLYLCGNNCGVYANRAYIVNGNITDQSAKAPAHAARRTIGNPNGTPTNLNGLNGNVKAQKALIDGHIYIIRDNKMYNAQGLFVK